MKVLVCLLSDQHVPNLLSVHHFQPDRLVLVESKTMKIRCVAKSFLAALELGGLSYDESRHQIVSLEAEDDLQSVTDSLRQAFGSLPAASWIANLTGGTKPMSIATYEFFKALGGRLIYTNVARPARIIDFGTGRYEDCQHRLSIKEFLAGYGFESRKSDESMRAAVDRAITRERDAHLLALEASSQDILQVSPDVRARLRSRGGEILAEQCCFTSSELRNRWFGSQSVRVIDRYEAEFLTGGWLEVFIWSLLRRHAEELNVWDVQLGLDVGKIGASSGNDFDVSFMHNHGLAMIECKSGSQEHDRGTEILYKVDAVSRQFKALRVRTFLATTSSHVLDNSQKIKESIQNRADIYNCRILTCETIRALAQSYENGEVVRGTLFPSRNPSET